MGGLAKEPVSLAGVRGCACSPVLPDSEPVIDDIPGGTREHLKTPARVIDIMQGRFGEAAEQEFLDWMSKDGGRTIEMIHRAPVSEVKDIL